MTRILVMQQASEYILAPKNNTTNLAKVQNLYLYKNLKIYTTNQINYE